MTPERTGALDRERVWEFRDIYTGIASSVVRQLGFAAIAIIWVFRVDRIDQVDAIASDLRLPAILVVAALTADVLQYIWSSAAWGIFAWYKEKQVLERGGKEPFYAPGWINFPSWTFFSLKIGLMAVAYVLIGVFVQEQAL